MSLVGIGQRQKRQRVVVKACDSFLLIARYVYWRLVMRVEGNSLVEFAFVLPIFVAVLMGITSFSAAFKNKFVLTNAVQQGALAIQQAVEMSDPCEKASSVIESTAPTLDPSQIKYTITVVPDGASKSSTYGPTAGGTSCSGVKPESNSSATVMATYPCNLNIYGFTYLKKCVLTSQLTVPIP